MDYHYHKPHDFISSVYSPNSNFLGSYECLLKCISGTTTVKPTKAYENHSGVIWTLPRLPTTTPNGFQQFISLQQAPKIDIYNQGQYRLKRPNVTMEQQGKDSNNHIISVPNKHMKFDDDQQQEGTKCIINNKQEERKLSLSPSSNSSESDSDTNLQIQGLGGERRLKINFIELGKITTPPQYFGKSGCIIPDGLCGIHEMYSQRWKFQLTHGDIKGTTVITWTITNMISGKTVSMTETPVQAMERQTRGHTISSVIMRKALERRVMELEVELEQMDPTSNGIANLKNLIRELRPKQRNEGILFFGLRHKVVQVRDE